MDSWMARRGTKSVGPMSMATLQDKAFSGKLKPSDQVKLVGQNEWQLAGSIRGLFPSISNQQLSDDVQLEAVVPKDETAATPVPPPFSSSPKPLNDILEVANRQKQILWMILISIPATFIPFATLVTGVIQIYFIVKLAKAVGSSAWLYAVLAFLPLIGLIALLRLNGKATKILKDNGVAVGLMGANSDDLKKFQNIIT